LIRVLFVCTGNICRSPTAEAVFRHMVESQNLSHAIEADSCGITDFHEGEPADSRSRETAESHGFDMSGLRARRLLAIDYERFDYLLAMDGSHLREILDRGKRLKADLDPARACLFMDFAPHMKLRDVPDPYYGGDDGFERVLEMIEAASRGLIETIHRDHL